MLIPQDNRIAGEVCGPPGIRNFVHRDNSAFLCFEDSLNEDHAQIREEAKKGKHIEEPYCLMFQTVKITKVKVKFQTNEPQRMEVFL